MTVEVIDELADLDPRVLKRLSDDFEARWTPEPCPRCSGTVWRLKAGGGVMHCGAEGMAILNPGK